MENKKLIEYFEEIVIFIYILIKFNPRKRRVYEDFCQGEPK